MPIFLTVVRGPSQLLNTRCMMPSAHTMIGSSETADLKFPKEAGVAPIHAEISLSGRDMIVKAIDLNPVLVLGQKALQHQIKLGSTFSLGDALELRYEYTPSKQKGTFESSLNRLPANKSAPLSSAFQPAVTENDAPDKKIEPVKAPEPAKKPDTDKAIDLARKAEQAKKEQPRALAEVKLQGTPVTFEELTAIPIFMGLPGKALAKLPGSVVKHTYEAGEIICREGDYGFTAFYILEGACEVYLTSPMAHVKSVKDERSGGFMGLLRQFQHKLLGKNEDRRPTASQIRFIPIDGPEDLPLNNPIGYMKVGDVFGEMSCTSLYPRSATVRATQKCVMLEMLSNVLLAMKDNPAYKKKYEEDYRKRALGQHLRSVDIFSTLDENFIDQLRDRVELLNYKKGEIIVKEGDVADAFYLIRFGNVKVSKQYPGGETVINYLGRSEFFGEMGLLKCGTREATCSALDRVECVRIKKPDFDFLLSWYDDMRPKLEEIAAEREKATTVRTQELPTLQLGEMMGQELMQAQNLLLLDLTKCTRCDECVRACADSHDGVTRLVREGLRFDKFLVATSCRSCMDPVCMPGCPVGSIHRQQSMEIIIEDWCIGCGLCAKNCPYGNINMHAFSDEKTPVDALLSKKEPQPGVEVKKAAPAAKEKKKAVTCDLCSDLKEPSCVYACPHDAAFRVDARKFFETGGDIKKSQV